MKLIDRTGIRYGMLTVVGRAANKSAADTNARWECLCDCGKTTIAYGQDLGRGTHKSCGCIGHGKGGQKNKTHGMSRTVVYRAWNQMKSRCENPASVKYRHYGGRGIKVCERWQSFENFVSDMGHPGDGMSLDRIDYNGNYEPGNCRWASRHTQGNNRRTVTMLTHNDVTLSVSGWAKTLGVSVSTFRDRITANFPPEKLFAPNLKKAKA